MTDQQILALAITYKMQKAAISGRDRRKEYAKPVDKQTKNIARGQLKATSEYGRMTPEQQTAFQTEHPDRYKAMTNPLGNMPENTGSGWLSGLSHVGGSTLSWGGDMWDHLVSAPDEIDSMKDTHEKAKKAVEEAGPLIEKGKKTQAEFEKIKKDPLAYIRTFLSDKSKWPWIAAFALPLLMMMGGSMSSMARGFGGRPQAQPQRRQQVMYGNQPYAYR